MKERISALKPLLAPRFWGMWLALGLLRLVICLPYRWQLKIGAALGRLFQRLVPKRVRIAEQNIRHCLADLDDQQVAALLRQHFEAIGISMLETAFSWWGSRRRIEPLLASFEGVEHLKALQAQGQGVILLSAHFLTLDIGGRLLGFEAPFAAVYRPMNNPLLEYFTSRGRNRHTEEAIPKDNIKQMIKTLRRGGTIWFAPDQQHQGNHSALVPFFGQPAHSATVTSTIARLSKAKVLPFSVRRDADGHHLRILPPLEDFPSGDEVADTLRYHRLIEEQVRLAPEQYLWVHKRFKDAPDFDYDR